MENSLGFNIQYIVKLVPGRDILWPAANMKAKVFLVTAISRHSHISFTVCLSHGELTSPSQTTSKKSCQVVKTLYSINI